MRCKSCGTESNVAFKSSKGMFLCTECSSEIPRKVSREEFERLYWNEGVDQVPHAFRREFWEDYQQSRYSKVADYIAATRTEVYCD